MVSEGKFHVCFYPQKNARGFTENYCVLLNVYKLVLLFNKILQNFLEDKESIPPIFPLSPKAWLWKDLGTALQTSPQGASTWAHLARLSLPPPQAYDPTPHLPCPQTSPLADQGSSSPGPPNAQSQHD